MLFKLLFLACLLHAAESGSWKFVGRGCVGARSTSYKQIKYTGSSCFIASIKLVHWYGYIGCSGDRRSYWGCAQAHTNIGMFVTDINNQVIYPLRRLVHFSHTAWYKLPGYTSTSPELILSVGHPKYLAKGEKIRIWYGEDLYDYTEHNNHGTTCMHVYVYCMSI